MGITQQQGQGEYLITVHGLARTWRSMRKPQRFFARQGYRVRSFSYPSTRYDLATLVREYFVPYVETFCSDHRKTVHILTHSMGGILVRYYLKDQHPPNLGRVVMLAPPNQGSEIVDIEKRWFIFRKFLGPAGQQLGTDAESIPLQLGPVNFELGVIAGDRSIEFHHSPFIPGPDDGKVAVERAKVEGMQDFLVMHHTHTCIMRDTEVLRQAKHFFKTGRFRHSNQ